MGLAEKIVHNQELMAIDRLLVLFISHSVSIIHFKNTHWLIFLQH